MFSRHPTDSVQAERVGTVITYWGNLLGVEHVQEPEAGPVSFGYLRIHQVSHLIGDGYDMAIISTVSCLLLSSSMLSAFRNVSSNGRDTAECITETIGQNATAPSQQYPD